MATQKKSTHTVGNLNSSDVRTIPNVLAGEDMENYSLVQLAYTQGERTATYLNNATEAYLLCAVEVMYDNEMHKEFYVGKDEYARIVHLEKGVRFETSGYTPISGVEPARDQFASWDVATKKFVLSATAPATPAAGKVFKVVDVVPADYTLGVNTVRLEVQ